MRHAELFSNAELAEYTIHKQLEDVRLSSTEWFNVRWEDALVLVKQLKEKEKDYEINSID